MRNREICIVSPWPPSMSGVADVAFSQALLFVKSGYVVYVVTNENNAVVVDGIRIITPEQFLALPDDLLVIHHIGNNWNYHSFMLPLMCEKPGVVVLHDIAYLDLCFGLFMPGASGGLYRLLSKYYGSASARRLMLLLQEGTLFKNRSLFLHYPLFEPLIENAKAVITYSSFGAQLVKQRMPDISVITTDMVFADFSEAQIARLRAKSKADDATIVFASFGHLGHFKQPLEIIDAVVKVPVDLPWQFRFVGPLSQSLKVEISARIPPSLIDRFVFTGALSDAAYTSEMLNADLAIQLRWPTLGETSAVVRRCIQIGLPLVVTNAGAMAEAPPHVLRVPANSPGAPLAKHLFEYAKSVEYRHRLRHSAQEHARSIDPARISQELLERLEAEMNDYSSRSGSFPILEIYRDAPPHPAMRLGPKEAMMPAPTVEISQIGAPVSNGRTAKDRFAANDPIFEGAPGLFEIETNEGDSFRWVSSAFKFLVPLANASQMTIELHAYHETEMSIIIAGVAIKVPISVGRKIYSLKIPTSRVELQGVTISFRDSVTLAEVFGNDDHRIVGAQFFSVSLVRRAPESKRNERAMPASFFDGFGQRRLKIDMGDNIFSSTSAEGFSFVESGSSPSSCFRWIGESAWVELPVKVELASILMGGCLEDAQVLVTVNGIEHAFDVPAGQLIEVEVPVEDPQHPTIVHFEVDKVLRMGDDSRELGLQIHALELKC